MELDLEKYLNKNVIITFIDWQDSVTKKDYDLMYSYSLFYKDQSIPNFLFLKNGPALVRIDSKTRDDIIFFDYRQYLFNIRSIKDIANFKLFEGSYDDIFEYLNNNIDQPDNKPVFNSVFSDDPSGSFGSIDHKNHCGFISLIMLQMMALNLVVNYSRLYDKDFFDKIRNKCDLNNNNVHDLEYKSVETFNKIYNKNKVLIYRLLMERGVLYRDKSYLKTFT